MINEKEYKLLKEAKIEKYEKYKKASDYFKANIKKFNQSMLDDLPTESEEKEMLKINQEEYVILKEALNEGYEWITRDKHNLLCKHRHKPLKNNHWTQEYWGNIGNRYKGIDDNLLQFVQWEDEEPYSIAELIREYEDESEKAKVTKQEIIKECGMPESDWAEVIDRYKWHLEQENYVVIEKPAIPKFVAEYLRGKEEYMLYELLHNDFIYDDYNELAKWLYNNDDDTNKEREFSLVLANIYGYKLEKDGYKLEKEQKFYALVKGHENISSDDKYWNYCITDESLDIGDNKVHADVLAEYVLNATKDDWANLGVNDDNADFVLVDEL